MIRNAVIENQDFDLSGQYAKACYFENCRLTLNPHPERDTVIKDCTITRCTLIGTGWPPETIGPGRRIVNSDMTYDGNGRPRD